MLDVRRRARSFFLLVSSLLVGDFASGQKTSTWTGKGSDDDWTTSKNWDTPEDPDGGDTAIVPHPDGINLDANRSLAILDLRGETGSPVTILGSSTLTVNSGLLWEHARLLGSGTFISSNNSVIKGLADFGNWRVTLNDSVTLDASVKTENQLNFAGTVAMGSADIDGDGSVFIQNSLTKELAGHSGEISAASLTVNGPIRVAKGTLVLKPKSLQITNPAKFRVQEGAQLRLTTDVVDYSGVTFENYGDMDITDESTATETSVRFFDTNVSEGRKAVEIGGSGVYGIEGILSGPWLMRGKALEGNGTFAFNDVLFLNGEADIGFDWRSGELRGNFVNNGEVVIRAGGNPTPAIQGSFTTNKRMDLKSGNLQMIEVEQNGGSPNGSQLLVASNGSLTLWEDTNIVNKAGDTLNKLTVMSGGSISAFSQFDDFESKMAVDSEILGEVYADRGTLLFSGGVDFTGTKFFIGFAGSATPGEVRTNSSTRMENTEFTFRSGGYFTFADKLRKSFLSGSIKGSGDGSVRLGEATVVMDAAEGFSIGIGSSGDQARFLVFRENANAPETAIRIPFSRTVKNDGKMDWSGGTIVTRNVDAQAPLEDDEKGTLKNDGTLTVLVGAGATRFEDTKVQNHSSLVIGDSSSANLELENSPLLNKRNLKFDGDGRVSSVGFASSSMITNEGTVVKETGAGTSIVFPPFDNRGCVIVRTGTLQFNGEVSGLAPVDNEDPDAEVVRPKWRVEDGATLRFNRNRDLFVLGSDLEIVGPDSRVLNSSGQRMFGAGDLLVSEEGSLSVSGRNLEVGGDLTVEGLIGSDGSYTATDIRISGTGVVSPGRSPGPLGFKGNLEMDTGARYIWEADASGSDTIVIDGSATVAGVFSPRMLNSYSPTIGDRFTVLTADALEGEFESVDLSQIGHPVGIALSYTETSVVATVVAYEAITFSDWRNQQFSDEELAQDMVSSLSADPDQDGLSNYLEYLLGLRATVKDRAPIDFKIIDTGPGFGALTTRICFPWFGSDENDSYAVDWSSDLVGWNEASWETLPPTAGDNPRLLTLEASSGAPADEAVFYRLRVQQK